MAHDDSLGFDFRVETARHEYLYEAKSAMDGFPQALPSAFRPY
jgi:hypothetical protein